MNLTQYSANTKDVGGIPVARLLPQKGKRTIGAWCFLDHAGPADFPQGNTGLQVGSHPHTNLQTFTWMLQGEVWHQDSLGNQQLIRPKQVNLMTAGTGNTTGISHTEQTAENSHTLHAVQLWIALPLNQNIAPTFEHYPTLPEWSEEGIDYILTTGSYHGHTAPTTQYTPLVGVDIQFTANNHLTLSMQSGWEYGILVIDGEVQINGETYHADQLISIEQGDEQTLELTAKIGTHIMLLGGEPLPHPTLIWWNFVAATADDLRQAVADWNGGHERFGNINLAGTELKRLVAPEVPSGLK